MEIEIESKKNNPLIDRTEVHFTINHQGKGTPDREIIRSELADKLNVKKDNVIVNHLNSGFGIHISTGYAKVYKSVEISKGLERKHILQRNKLIEKGGKKKEEKPAEATAEKVEEPAAEPPKEDENPAEEPPKGEEKPADNQPPENETQAEEPPKEEKPKTDEEKKE
jgi:small subunit ribosomal protein S24e